MHIYRTPGSNTNNRSSRPAAWDLSLHSIIPWMYHHWRKMRATVYISLVLIFIIHTSSAIAIDSTPYEDSECLSTLKSDGISLINHGITVLNSSIKISGRFFEALQDLYNIDNSTVLPAILNSVKNISKYVTNIFEQFKDVDLEKAVIYTYTQRIHRWVEYFMKENTCGKKNLTVIEKELAPLTAYFMAVLLYSPNLPKETNLTYVKVEWFEVDRYKVGKTFIWPSFTIPSAYEVKSKQGHGLALNNSRESMWSPRNIEQYGTFSGGRAIVYPPGARFRVMKKYTKDRKVYMYADLISEG